MGNMKFPLHVTLAIYEGEKMPISKEESGVDWYLYGCLIGNFRVFVWVSLSGDVNFPALIAFATNKKVVFLRNDNGSAIEGDSPEAYASYWDAPIAVVIHSKVEQ